MKILKWLYEIIFRWLLNRNYNAVVGRGLISPTTKKIEFFCKLEEEFTELCEDYDFN